MTRILIVDDDEQVRSMLRLTLERAGFDVAEAADGLEAVRAHRRAPADLVITDIVMPEMEGIETIRELRRERPDLPIIAISGGGQIAPEGYLQVAGKIGAARTFTKPVDRGELLAAVRELAAGEPARRA